MEENTFIYRKNNDADNIKLTNEINFYISITYNKLHVSERIISEGSKICKGGAKKNKDFKK